MKTINFTQFKVYTDVTKENSVILDVKTDIANMLYVACIGLQAHALALRIYNSDGIVTLTPDEIQVLNEAVQANCKPAFIDGFMELINKETNDN